MKRTLSVVTLILLAIVCPGLVHADSVAKLPRFLAGGDISLLTQEEQDGTVYKLNGRPMQFLSLAKKLGWNCMRLRLWVNPAKHGIYVNDLAYTEALGRRIKSAGFYLDLDIHYSDSWADPAKQTKPATWDDLDFDALTKQVHNYTADVVKGMIESGAAPDIVQIGNEIPGGLLWPDGKDWGPGHDFKNLGILLTAASHGVVDGARGHNRPLVMIHIDRGADWSGTKWFFDNIDAQHVPFDLIGESYYPAFHGPLSAAKECLDNAAVTYKKPIVVVETGYPYSGDPVRQVTGKGSLDYPVSPAGQVQFLTDLNKVVKAVPNGLGKGIIYWEPEWIPANGMMGSWDSKTLFDNSGNALPAASLLKGQE